MSFDTLATLLTSRQSCRGYLPDPVPQSETEAVLTTAQNVPSWCNSQPWHVTACGSEETNRLREALYAHAAQAKHNSDVPFPSAYEGLYKDRRRECGWQLYDAVGVQKGDREGSGRQMMENFRLFGAPHFLLITTPKALGPYGILDCGAFATAVLLGFEARGIGAIAMASVAGFAGFMRGWFDVPDDRDILCGISFGYADQNHPANAFRTTRAPLAEVVDWR
ncbi:nitroreductase [Pseudoprimorskyibacter insulae]|uniref:Nitroreductase NfnB n=1 Tax=Pseudoprimorskyibacter insulae TaxID=1695997 RepID=A0A2R8AVQ8_9RHOB|nr:nitroreductase [Pseudoprimorskyibacter insulae]SPF79994.1 Nitroreductase NfnB [Pseudoprimorskyibacter insulae]